MPTITLEAAQSILAPHDNALLHCVTEAWRKYRDLAKPLAALWHPTYRANLVCQLMVDEARTRFSDVPGVRLLDTPERFVIVVQDQLILRLKKLNEQYETANYPTPTADRVDAQLPITGIPMSATWLTVGYVLNFAQTDIASVNVVCAVAKRLEWEYSLTNPGAKVEQLRLQTETAERPRVRAKGAGKDRQRSAASSIGTRRGNLRLVKKRDDSDQ